MVEGVCVLRICFCLSYAGAHHLHEAPKPALNTAVHSRRAALFAKGVASIRHSPYIPPPPPIGAEGASRHLVCVVDISKEDNMVCQ